MCWQGAGSDFGHGRGRHGLRNQGERRAQFTNTTATRKAAAKTRHGLACVIFVMPALPTSTHMPAARMTRLTLALGMRCVSWLTALDWEDSKMTAERYCM